MRSGRSFLFLILVAAGLGSYIYFVEMKRDPTETEVTAKEKVFTIAPASVEEVEITNDKAQTTRVAKKDTIWSIVAPSAMEADSNEVIQMVSQLESLERAKVIEENPASAAPFGLEPPRIRVAFKAAGEPTPRVLLIGNKTPTGGDLYAKVEGQPAVFLIGGFLEDTFNRKPFDLREKTVLKFTSDGVTGITLVQGTTRIVLEKTGNDWKLTAPSGAKADGAAVGALIGQVAQAKMTGITEGDASPAALKEHGLDKPQAIVTIRTGSATAELAIGKKEDDTHVFARDLSRPLIFSVDKTLFDGLAKKADDFRVKDVFAYRSFTATGMDVVYGGETYTFAKKKEGEVDKWSQTKPAEKAVDAAKFDDFLTTLSNLRAESFSDKPLTGGDSVTVFARFGEVGTPQAETVTLRKVGSTVHAIRSGEAGAAVVSTTDFDRAMGLFRELTGAK